MSALKAIGQVWEKVKNALGHKPKEFLVLNQNSSWLFEWPQRREKNVCPSGKSSLKKKGSNKTVLVRCQNCYFAVARSTCTEPWRQWNVDQFVKKTPSKPWPCNMQNNKKHRKNRRKPNMTSLGCNWSASWGNTGPLFLRHLRSRPHSNFSSLLGHLRPVLAFFPIPLLQVLRALYNGCVDTQCCSTGGWRLLLPLIKALQSYWLLGGHSASIDRCSRRQIIHIGFGVSIISLSTGTYLNSCYNVLASSQQDKVLQYCSHKKFSTWHREFPASPEDSFVYCRS